MIYAVVSSADVTNDGILNEIGDTLTIDPDAGNGNALAEVERILSGGINSIVIDGAGTGHRVGDPLVFTTTQSNVFSPSAFVSVVDGALLLDGTDGSSTNAGDEIILESGTLEHIDTTTLNLSLNLSAELGGKFLETSEVSLTGSATASTFDSTVGTFDSTVTTFDAT